MVVAISAGLEKAGRGELRLGASAAPQAREGEISLRVPTDARAVWLYAALAPRYGARPTTAVIAGVAWWTMKTLQSAKWAGLGFVEFTKGLIPVGAMTLVSAVLASMAGAWLYNRVAVPTNGELLAP
jgi:hypothetical protein